MKHVNNDCCFVIAAIFIFPGIFFPAGSALNIEGSLPAFYDMAEPLWTNLGLNEKLGLNAFFLTCFGPIVALRLTLYSLVKDRGEEQKTEIGDRLFFMRENGRELKHWLH